MLVINLVYFNFVNFSSMIIRDLTLRSAASFGSFHLIRLLYDEYMFYLVEHKVAKAIGASPMAVMGEVRDNKNIKKIHCSRIDTLLFSMKFRSMCICPHCSELLNSCLILYSN